MVLLPVPYSLTPRLPVSHVLIVDDEPAICWGLREALGDESHDVTVAGSAEEALRAVDDGLQPDTILLDVRLPGMDGLTAMSEFRTRVAGVPIVVMTAFGDLQTAVQAVQSGAFEYLVKPFDLDVATETVTRALALTERGTTVPPSSPEDTPSPDGTLVGASPAMQEVFKQIALVAASDVPVLVTGESGTGKELVARAVHQHGPRRDAPFLPICIAALSPGLVESELFGHVKGAFTGAAADRRGLLELAHGGTVLLDEIGDTELGLQVKLLRALEQREVTPVGDPRPRPFDTRIVAATNRPLPELVEKGEFRDDLFFRLSVFHIRLPPLRERVEDVPALARHFLSRVRGARQNRELSEAAVAELKSRRWPGNVRELRNVIEHAAIVARGPVVEAADLPSEATPPAAAGDGSTSRDDVSRVLAEWTRRTLAAGEDSKLHERLLELAEPPVLAAVLEHTGFNRAAAAELLGLHRTTLRQKLRKYGLEPNAE